MTANMGEGYDNCHQKIDGASYARSTELPRKERSHPCTPFVPNRAVLTANTLANCCRTVTGTSTVQQSKEAVA
jgi:hypothetical protein